MHSGNPPPLIALCVRNAAAKTLYNIPLNSIHLHLVLLLYCHIFSFAHERYQ